MGDLLAFGFIHLLAVLQAGVATDSTVVAGTVRDQATGSPLPQALIAFADRGHTVSDDQGRYRLRTTLTGPQHMVVRRIGYRMRTLHALLPPAGRLTIDVTLEPTAILLDPLSVDSDTPAVAPESEVPARGYPDRRLSLTAMRNDPTLVETDVLLATSGGEIAMRPESPDGVHLRGGAADQVAYLLDGIPIHNPYHAAGSFSAWNPDALAGIDVYSFNPPAGTPDGLSGLVEGRTRRAGIAHQTSGAITTTQARGTLEGPVYGRGSGYLLSLRSAFPGLLLHRREPTYLGGTSLDGIAALDLPAFAGHLHLLAYGNHNRLPALARVGADPGQPRNVFGWESRSVGATWSRAGTGRRVTLRAWYAASEAEATWRAADSGRQRLESARAESGVLAKVELTGSSRAGVVGIQAATHRTRYQVTDSGGRLRLLAHTPVASLFAGYERTLAGRLVARLDLTGAVGAGGLLLSPAAEASWSISPNLSLTLGASRRHQFSQSLRNPESVVGNIFPAELFLGAGSDQVAVARSDGILIALDARPTAGLRLGAQAHLRRLTGLALVGAGEADPFASGSVPQGSSTARGLALEVEARGARWASQGRYAWQRVRLRAGDSSYTPQHAVTHALTGGIVLFPLSRLSFKVSGQALFGRRTTAVEGPFEWEGCNLLDRGCEFAGSPYDRTEPVGATTLPVYVRVDAGIRYHLHVRVAGRDALLTFFGGATNLLARSNVLTETTDPQTGRRRPITMRPRSPLVLGLEWTY